MTYRSTAWLRVSWISPKTVPFGMVALVVMTAALGTLSADRAVAVTYWLEDAADADWKNAANWSDGVPSTSNDAYFNGPSNKTTVDLNGDVNVGDFDFSGSTCAAYTFINSGMMNLRGDLTIHAGVTASITFSSSPRVSFRIAGDASHTLKNDGTGSLNIDHGIMSGIAGGIVIFDGSGNTNVLDLQVRRNTNQLSIIKNGSGTVTIMGAHGTAPTADDVGYSSGTTTINAGVLSINAEANLGGNPAAFDEDALLFGGGTLRATASFDIDDSNRGVTIGAGGGAFEVGSGLTLGIVNEIVGTGTLTKLGTGTLVLNHDNSSFSGAIVVDSGTLTLGNAAALGGATGDTTVNTGATLNLNSQTTAEPIRLAGGTLHSPTGATSVVNGTLTLDAPSFLVADGYLNIYGKITGSGGFSSTGGRTVKLYNHDNDYTGPTVFGSTYTDLEEDEVIPDTSDVTLNKYFNLRGHTETIRSLAGGSDAYIYNSFDTEATLIIGAGGGGADFAGRLWDNNGNAYPFDIRKIGAGTQTFSGTNSDFRGTVTIEGGVLKLGSVNALGSTAAADHTIVKTGGTLDLNGQATAEPIRLAGGTLTNTGGSVVYAAALTLDTSSFIDAPTSGELTIDSSITGVGGLTKSGAGAVILGAANGYSGDTIVQQGTLKLGAGGSIGNSPLIDVQAGATFDVADVTGGFQLATGQTLMGTGDVLGDLTLLDGSIHAPGSSPGIQTVTGDYDLQAGATLVLELAGLTAGAGYDQVDVDGTVSLGGDLDLLLGFAPAIDDIFTIIDNDGADAVTDTFAGLAEGDEVSALSDGRSYDFRITYQGNDGNDVVLRAVPEPGTLALLFIAMGLGLGVVRRRRQVRGR